MKNGEYTHTSTSFYFIIPYLRVGEEIPSIFYTLFNINSEDLEKNTSEEQVDYLINSHDKNDVLELEKNLHLDTMSKFAKSVKDVIHIKGDVWSNPSENIKVTPSFLAISAFTKFTSI